MQPRMAVVDRANGSLRRGRTRLTGVVALLFAAVGGAVLWIRLHQFHVSSPLRLPVVALVLPALAVVMVFLVLRAHKPDRRLLTVSGIEGAAGSILLWRDITAAECNRGWLHLRANERGLMLILLFAPEPEHVVDAVQSLLPSGVTLQRHDMPSASAA